MTAPSMTSTTNNNQSSSETWEINTMIEPTFGQNTDRAESSSTASVDHVSSINPENSTENSTGKALRITGAGDSSSGLSPAVIGVIVASVLLVFIVALIAAVYYRRNYKYIFRHGKLIEEKNPADFYKIAFPSRGEDNVTFDTGIENPTYDCLHDPTHSISQPGDTRT
ncbi:unnamed protein product [Candidula unifasciata]|uniref:Uncharacterized protein n=1 Tax=Candidula unifasciata TaxID=100452 RepID=A0A8S3Z443_9EUPU|nr:unnamed protein product [Candidula unifasciata]